MDMTPLLGENVTTPDGLPDALVADPDQWGSEWRSIMDAQHDVRLWDGTPTDLPEIERIIECWFTSNESGDNAGPIGTELQVYAVLRFKDGRWGYLEAWNDYTGWGCQDGVEWNVADTAEQLRPLITDEGRAHLEWAK